MACQSAQCVHRDRNYSHNKMLTGSTSQVFVMPSAGGSGEGDDPSRYPCAMKSTHELDDVIPSVAMPARFELWASKFRCPICQRKFETQNGVNGHMNLHTKRRWRAMKPPPASGYVCDHCRAPFGTKQALGGHRASHSCSWLAARAEAQRPVVVFDFDLNEPAPEAEAQEEEEED
uniref:Uncharacterized protein n=1 Tax=Avena sativa TaxID=4498 RepID=A0ACD5UJC6_AVESA